MKYFNKIKKNFFLLAIYHVAIASYLASVSAMNAGCSQISGLLGGGATSLTDTSTADEDDRSHDGIEGAHLTQASGSGPYGLKVNPLPSNNESAIYGIFSIPR
jgi:hypothetical protein